MTSDDVDCARLAADLSRQLDMARTALADALARLALTDPPDVAGKRRRLEQLAVEVYGPAWAAFSDAVRDELAAIEGR